MDIGTFWLACLRFRHFPLAFHAYFSRSSQEPVARSCLLYTAHPTVSKQVSSAVIPSIETLLGSDVTYFLLTIPHRRFTCVHLLATHLAVLNGTTFNHRSPPIGFPNSSMKWFAIRACTPNAVDLPPSLVKLRMNTLPIATHGEIHSRDTHFACKDTHIFIINNENRSFYIAKWM